MEENRNWFFEKTPPKSDHRLKFGIEIKEKLYSCKTKFQDMEFYDTYEYGKIMVLDGMVQTSEKDEFIYHENITHLPMFYNANPKDVLIIGGGDGGVLREVLRHPVKTATMVEIDGDVVEYSKKLLPTISDKAFDDKRTNLIIGDGKVFVETTDKKFDVIILDLSDPEGPAEELIGLEFYKNVKKILSPGGVIAIQSGSFTYQPKLVAEINKRVISIFESVKVHRVTIPTYEGGEFSLTIASDIDFSSVKEQDIENRMNKLELNLKYYTPQIHLASAVLPKYLQDILK